MTDDAPIADETLQVLRQIPTQTLIDALWVKEWPSTYIQGARPLQQGQSMAGRAVTLRFVPHRPDLARDKPKGEGSAEYVAFELCGPGEVLAVDAMGWSYSSVGGDIKFMRLWQRGIGGLVTDGGVRDSVSLKEYGFPVYPPALRPNKVPPTSGRGRSTTPSSAAESSSALGTRSSGMTMAPWSCRGPWSTR